jgi:hypothetical protein
MELSVELWSRPFTLSEVKAAGHSGWAVRRMLRDGTIVPMLRGVYRAAVCKDTLELRCEAAARVLRPFGVVCDRTAAWLHGVDTFEYAELDILPPLDTFVLRGHARTRRPGCRGGRRDLLPADVMRMHGIQVTTPLRTALDLACSMSERDALACLDGFMRAHNITREELEAELPRYRRRRGVVQLRRLIPLATPLAESSGESWTRMAIIQAGLPAPEPQYWVRHGGRKRYRLDLAYVLAKVAIEYDGRKFHRKKKARAKDAKRRKWLRDHGWTVIVVTKDSFSFDAWMAWTNEISEALRRAA